MSCSRGGGRWRRLVLLRTRSPGAQPSPEHTSCPGNATCRAERARSSSRAMLAAEPLAGRCWGC